MTKDYEGLLAQVQRNIGQGELGQSLAQGKIDGIKADFSQISNNLIKEAHLLQQMREADKKEAKDGVVPPIDEKISSLAQVEKKSSQLLKQFDTIVDMEKQLDRDCKGVETATSLAELPEFKDDEINSMRAQMTKALAEVKNNFVSEQNELKKQKEEADERASSAGTANKPRTQKDKDDMAAFLAGNIA